MVVHIRVKSPCHPLIYQGEWWRPGDRIRGALVCSQCNTVSPFELAEEAVTFKPGSHMFVELATDASEEVRGFYDESRLCISSGAPRAAATMARATLEQALEERGCTGKLDSMISHAVAQKIITQAEVTIAHGSRLIGNDAIHEANKSVTLGEAIATLSACVTIVNRML